MNLKRFKPVLLLASALILGLLSASVSSAQVADWRCTVKDHADNVVHLSRNLRTETLHSAKYSQVFGQMLAEIGIMEGNAAVLKAWAPHRDACYLEEQAEKVHQNVHRMAALLDVAKLRSSNGLDRPLTCSLELDQLLGQIEAEITHAIGDIPKHVVYSPVPAPVAPMPVVPAGGYIVHNPPPIVIGRPNYSTGPNLQFSTRNGLQIQLNLGNRPGHVHQPSVHNPGPQRRDHHFDDHRPTPHQQVAQKRLNTAMQGGTNIYGGPAVVRSFQTPKVNTPASHGVHGAHGHGQPSQQASHGQSNGKGHGKGRRR